MKRFQLKHSFVEFIPDELEEGVLYVSVQYATASHKCCCGCGREVVTPFSPTDWMLIFDGKTVSLNPSVGSWSFPCRSHYWIRNNTVRWAEKWSQDRVEAARSHDAERKRSYYAEAGEVARKPQVPKEPTAPPSAPASRWQRFKAWFHW